MLRLLHIIPYNALYPPKNGGQLRCFHLMDQLSQHFEMDVLSYVSGQDMLNTGCRLSGKILFHHAVQAAKAKKGFAAVVYRYKNAIRYRWLRRSLLGPAQQVVMDFYPLLQALAKTKQFDLIVFEHLSSMMLAPVCRRLFPGAQLVLDAHNIDSSLLPEGRNKERTYYFESTLFKQVDSFWACSVADCIRLEEMNQGKIQGRVVPNGIVLPPMDEPIKDAGPIRQVLFCGSLDYAPNREGLRWFLQEIWPLVMKKKPQVTFTIVGRGKLNVADFDLLQPGVQLVGEVESVEPYYRQASVAVVPLLSGSGTRLKVLEAMSFKVPVISTPIGIEGIDAMSDIQAKIAANAEQFASAVITILSDHFQAQTIGKRGYMLVAQKYTWEGIVNALVSELHHD